MNFNPVSVELKTKQTKKNIDILRSFLLYFSLHKSKNILLIKWRQKQNGGKNKNKQKSNKNQEVKIKTVVLFLNGIVEKMSTISCLFLFFKNVLNAPKWN